MHAGNHISPRPQYFDNLLPDNSQSGKECAAGTTFESAETSIFGEAIGRAAWGGAVDAPGQTRIGWDTDRIANDQAQDISSRRSCAHVPPGRTARLSAQSEGREDFRHIDCRGAEKTALLRIEYAWHRPLGYAQEYISERLTL